MKYPSDRFVKKKRTLHKIFCILQNSLELQSLVEDLVDFLESIMFINVYLRYTI